ASTSLISLYFVTVSGPTRCVSSRSLHDALPISAGVRSGRVAPTPGESTPASCSRHTTDHPVHTPNGLDPFDIGPHRGSVRWQVRSEEHTSELQSRFDLVCRLLRAKKKKRTRLRG